MPSESTFAIDPKPIGVRPRIKICGIVEPQLALKTAQCGADAIGLVFVPSSPRAVTIEQAQAILKVLPPYIAVVGLFRNALAADVQAVLDACALDMLQFHGDEPPEYCDQFSRPYVKAIPMLTSSEASAGDLLAGDLKWLDYACHFPNARGYLFDSHSPDVMGGSGKTFDWQMLVDASQQTRSVAQKRVFEHLVLAGGLRPDNVAEAIQRLQPWAVDVSSGVESTRGVKDYAKIQQFVQAVHSLNNH